MYSIKCYLSQTVWKHKGHLVRDPIPGETKEVGGLGIHPPGAFACQTLHFVHSGEFLCTDLCF